MNEYGQDLKIKILEVAGRIFASGTWSEDRIDIGAALAVKSAIAIATEIEQWGWAMDRAGRAVGQRR